MKVSALQTASCDILYSSTEGVGLETLGEAVNSAALATGIAEARALPTSENETRIFECGLYRVEITQTDEPGKPAKYLAAALSHITQQEFPNASEAIKNHSAVTSISIYRPVPSGASSEHDSLSDRADLQTAEEVLLVMGLLRSIALSLVTQSNPLAIYWASNSYLLTREKFIELASVNSLCFLCLHPSYYSLGYIQDGPSEIGLIMMGAEHLIGHQVSVEPGPYDPEFVYEIAISFVRHCVSHGRLMENGEIFGPSEEEVFQLHYEPRGEATPPALTIIPIRSHKLGVLRELPQADEPEDDGTYVTEDGVRRPIAELDPRDPIDAAILKRIEESKETKETTVLARPNVIVSLEKPIVIAQPPKQLAVGATEEEVPTACELEVEIAPEAVGGSETPSEAAAAAYAPPEGTSNRPQSTSISSVQELRQMALRMQRSDEELQTKPAGLFGRIRSLFG
ncbi:hypothetical protein [Roseibium sp. TrichSKD4]|uniref:hypothetical protein n=1 Tax=Roseibium sp. TrichSKD4 TaxID=744980 RepID=UPI00058CA552|nr:hypothetical protein [Roseibium sp. TrichSKD4]